MKAIPELCTPIGLTNFVKIKSMAQKRGIDVNVAVNKFILERALHRIFGSQHAELFTLKGGATLMYHEGCDPLASRATSDLDIDLHLDIDPTRLEDILKEVFATHEEGDLDDGVRWSVDELALKRIRNGAVGGGAVETWAQLGNAIFKFKIDVGYDRRPNLQFSKTRECVSILPDRYPAFSLRTYPVEYAFADKLQAGVRHGESVTRIRDYYDLYVFSTRSDIDDGLAMDALQQTFDLFDSPLPESAAAFTGLDPECVTMVRDAWPAYVKKINPHVPIPTDFAAVVDVIRERLSRIYAQRSETMAPAA